MKPDLSSFPALWLGLRQVESIRESLRNCLVGRPLPNQTTPSPIPEMKRWLSTQKVPELELETEFEEVRLAQTLSNGFEIGQKLFL